MAYFDIAIKARIRKNKRIQNNNRKHYRKRKNYDSKGIEMKFGKNGINIKFGIY